MRKELDIHRLVASNEHPNIIELIDFWNEEKLSCVVMELCEGNLADLLKPNNGPLTPRLLFEIVLQTAKGLQYLHKLRVCHRDLKPQNGI